MNTYENQAGDARQTDSPALAPGTELFRPRYRQLTPPELDLHDRIKGKAVELVALFHEVEPIHLVHIGPGKVRERGANVQMAIRHLEDAVYRAVKALTGPGSLMDTLIEPTEEGRRNYFGGSDQPPPPPPPPPPPATAVDALAQSQAAEVAARPADDDGGRGSSADAATPVPPPTHNPFGG